MLQRGQVGYLRDAVVTLPERLRKVVVEYFFEERQMQDIATDLGVTEYRVSQMRAEARVLRRAGLESILDTDSAPVDRRSVVAGNSGTVSVEAGECHITRKKSEYNQYHTHCQLRNQKEPQKKQQQT